MGFPIEAQYAIHDRSGEAISGVLQIRRGLTILIGSNGSGKTRVLKDFKHRLTQIDPIRRVRFISAGRIGSLEPFRSDFHGHSNVNYDSAVHGSKHEVARRHAIETLQGDFQVLAQRSDIQIKVQERLRKLFKRDVIIDWDAGQLKVMFSGIGKGATPYNSSREASGLVHLVAILTALYDDEVGVLLLDEPEVSLHPQLQAFLLQEILSVAGHPAEGPTKKLVIMATHSTEMVQIRRPDDLLSLVFFRDESAPLQIDPDASELRYGKIGNLIARLGQEHKQALFAHRPLLVEGPSDTIICSALANHLGMHLEAAGSQLVPVIGKGEMPVVSKLMRLCGKEPIVLTDADAICDGVASINAFIVGSAMAMTVAARNGHTTPQAMATSIYGTFAKQVAEKWSEIEAIATQHRYWTESEGESELAKRRAAFCTLFSLDAASVSALGSSWTIIQAQLKALLDVLDAGGLFVLRRGCIESYFLTEVSPDSYGKPAVAAQEIESFESRAPADLEDAYDDVVRCLRVASDSVEINEAEILQDLALSIVPAAHARIQDNTLGIDPNARARGLVGERANLFNLGTNGDSLTVALNSRILNVSGFPITIKRDEDASKAIRAALAAE